MENNQEQFTKHCVFYKHIEGFPHPAIDGSCRGCAYSYFPDLFDGGCQLGSETIFIQQRKTNKERFSDEK